MADVTLLVVLVVLLVGVPAGFLALRRRARQRRIPGSVLSPFDEVFNPAAHTAAIEVQLHREQGAPRPATGPGQDPGTVTRSDDTGGTPVLPRSSTAPRTTIRPG